MNLHEIITLVCLVGPIGYFIGSYDGREYPCDWVTPWIVKVILGLAVLSATVAITIRCLL